MSSILIGSAKGKKQMVFDNYLLNNLYHQDWNGNVLIDTRGFCWHELCSLNFSISGKRLPMNATSQELRDAIQNEVVNYRAHYRSGEFYTSRLIQAFTYNQALELYVKMGGLTGWLYPVCGGPHDNREICSWCEMWDDPSWVSSIYDADGHRFEIQLK